MAYEIAVRRSTGGQVLGRVFYIGGILDSGIGNHLSPIAGQKREEYKKDRKRFLHKVRFYTENEFKKKPDIPQIISSKTLSGIESTFT